MNQSSDSKRRRIDSDIKNEGGKSTYVFDDFNKNELVASSKGKEGMREVPSNAHNLSREKNANGIEENSECADKKSKDKEAYYSNNAIDTSEQNKEALNNSIGAKRNKLNKHKNKNKNERKLNNYIKNELIVEKDEEDEQVDEKGICSYSINKDKSRQSKHYLIQNLQDKSALLNDLTMIEENKLYVKNVKENITKKDLEEYFANIDGYVETRIVFNNSGVSRRFAYIEFDSKESANNFINMLQDSNVKNYKTFTIKNVNLYTSISKPQKTLYEEKKLFMKFTKCDIQNEENLKEKILHFFSNHSVRVTDIRLLGEGVDKHGYLEVEDNESVIKCVETIKECRVEDTHFSLQYCIPIIKKKIIYNIEKIKEQKEKSKQLKEEQKREENSCTIVVKNLHYNTRKNKLKHFFEQIGEIENIYLSKKVSEKNIKRNKGYAFITFKNANDATSSLILNDSIIDGRNILISKFFEDNKIKKNETDQAIMQVVGKENEKLHVDTTEEHIQKKKNPYIYYKKEMATQEKKKKKELI
ncbi:U4/U6 snRNA-associated-splicing factor [Plasmodium brasilianum]|uniref:U4/U6 snRNA-associated-splicing factor n=1 Tax=Plasmodium brasilianum TaxID=5824 RepID=A0ACB9YBV0_PLABR|nr:U4/U6 snRNA-associated-splicing factor [Plasmodium brasilianum]